MSKQQYEEMIESLATIRNISKKEAALIIIKAVQNFNENIKGAKKCAKRK